MSQVVITEQMQQLIDAIKQNPEVIDISVTAVPEGLLIPEKLVNPLQFIFTVMNPATNKQGVAYIIVPEVVYNNPVPMVTPSPIEHLLYAINFDLSNLKDGGDLICFLDPDTMKIIPVAGFDPTPVDITTEDPLLQSLASKILALVGIVRVEFHHFIDPDLKDEFQVDNAHRVFVYFDNYPPGRDNVGNASFILKDVAYQNEDNHDSCLRNIEKLVQDKRNEL